MKLLKLVSVEPTNKRFWQLKKYYENVYFPAYKNIVRINIKGMKTLLPLYLLPYEIWGTGKVDWENMPEFVLKEGDTVQF